MGWTGYDVSMHDASSFEVHEASRNAHATVRVVTTVSMRPKRNSGYPRSHEKDFLLFSARQVLSGRTTSAHSDKLKQILAKEDSWLMSHDGNALTPTGQPPFLFRISVHLPASHNAGLIRRYTRVTPRSHSSFDGSMAQNPAQAPSRRWPGVTRSFAPKR